jgi:exopolyphosphatase/guanosine-5'-triphosphate,3'-diphosphate pyrophosphatase
MMIIALISDIHGNLPALKAVLEDAELAGAKQIWSLGDLVGYIPFPNECIGLVRKKATASIAGNYDRKVMQFKQKETQWRKSKKPPKFDAFEWNSRNLNNTNREYLRQLPADIRRKTGRFRILLTHGSPQSIDEPVLPQTPRRRMVDLGQTADADIIVMGHTHLFMDRKVANRRFVNPGSVGLPVKSDLRASYALLEIEKDKVRVTERKVQYDVTAVIRALQQANLSEQLIKMVKLEYGIDLKNYVQTPSTGRRYPSGSQHTLKAVRNLARKCNYEKQHSEHVTLLALNLFDELRPLHKLTDDDRLLLNCAGLLHDIGWMEGQKGHHKAAMKIISSSKMLPFIDNQRSMVALIARYHRKALPKDSHPLYSRLSVADKQKTRILGGILRVADGLDRTHTRAVKKLECDFSKNNLTVKCEASSHCDFEIEAAYKKSDLLKRALGKNVRFIVIEK